MKNVLVALGIVVLVGGAVYVGTTMTQSDSEQAADQMQDAAEDLGDAVEEAGEAASEAAEEATQ